MDIARRAFLRAGGSFLAAGLACPLSPAFAASLAPSVAARSLALYNLHTGEKLKLEYWHDGQYDTAALAQINHVLRDHRTGDVHAMEPRLLDLLHALRTTLDSESTFEVISGYRSPATNAALHEKSSGVASQSLHMQGMAIDIRLPGRTLKALEASALTMELGGVGYYPTSDFVHVDVGRVRKWVGV